MSDAGLMPNTLLAAVLRGDQLEGALITTTGPCPLGPAVEVWAHPGGGVTLRFFKAAAGCSGEILSFEMSAGGISMDLPADGTVVPGDDVEVVQPMTVT